MVSTYIGVLFNLLDRLVIKSVNISLESRLAIECLFDTLGLPNTLCISTLCKRLLMNSRHSVQMSLDKNIRLESDDVAAGNNIASISQGSGAAKLKEGGSNGHEGGKLHLDRKRK